MDKRKGFKTNFVYYTWKCTLVLLCTILVGCYEHSQDTPEAVAETFAQSIATQDVESAVNCFEYGDEIMSFMGEMTGSDFSLSAMQRYISAAKESQLLPEITYEIKNSEVHEDKGVICVKFTYRFDDGETLHETSDEEDIPVYLHNGQWWIGEGFTNSQREMARRGMKFLEKIGSYGNRF